MLGRKYSIGGISFTEQYFRKFGPEQQIELMVEWFGERFDDPVHQTPYNGREGGYLWIHGGPYDADTEIQTEFSDVVEFDVMKRAVEDITSEGTYEWAPVVSDYNYDEEHEIEEPNTPRDGNVAEDLRGELITRLDRLEAVLLDYNQNLPPRNHNNPPELIEESIISSAQIIEVKEAVGKLRAEVGNDDPKAQALQEQATILSRIGEAMWSGVKVLAGGVAGSAAWEAIVWMHNNPKHLFDALMAVANTASQWSHQITGWF